MRRYLHHVLNTHIPSRLRLIVIIGLMLMGGRVLRAIDNAHFYRASLWYGEPRTAKPYLSTFDAIFVGASADKAFNCNEVKVPLFGLYGLEDMNRIVPEPDIPVVCDKGVFAGEFNLFEAQIHAYHNYQCGFFGHLHLPIRTIEVCNVELNNACSPKLCNNKDWYALRGEAIARIKEAGVCVGSTRESGVGDLSALLGWSCTRYDTCHTDFVDVAVQTGVLFPTGKRRDPNALFSFPLGYNGHFAIPVEFDIATGFFDWLNIGFHSDTMFFFHNNQLIRPRAGGECAGGIVRLEPARETRVRRGILWNLSVYAKADHAASGVSLLFGYTHNHQNKSNLCFCPAPEPAGPGKCPCNVPPIPAGADAIHDPIFGEWYMNVFHFLLEYDWANEDYPYAPHIGIEYNHIINGKNVFDADTAGGYLGFNIDWCY